MRAGCGGVDGHVHCDTRKAIHKLGGVDTIRVVSVKHQSELVPFAEGRTDPTAELAGRETLLRDDALVLATDAKVRWDVRMVGVGDRTDCGGMRRGTDGDGVSKLARILCLKF